MKTSAILKIFTAILLIGGTAGNIEAAKKRTKSRTTATVTPTLVKGEVNFSNHKKLARPRSESLVVVGYVC